MEATLTTPTILVVGGGFAGRAAVRHFLDSQVPARVVLVDEKPFFEFTPSVLRCIVQPSHIGKITFNQQTHPDLEFLEGRVTCLSETAATVFNIADGITSTIPYDYCVWATGVKQAPPIKLHSRNAKSTTATRREEFESFRQKAFQAKECVSNMTAFCSYYSFLESIANLCVNFQYFNHWRRADWRRTGS